MEYEIKIHPLNAKGKYYVDQNTCICFVTCEEIAPNNFKAGVGPNCHGTYVVKQPETPEEEELCREAMRCCAVEAILDDGEELK